MAAFASAVSLLAAAIAAVLLVAILRRWLELREIRRLRDAYRRAGRPDPSAFDQRD